MDWLRSGPRDKGRERGRLIKPAHAGGGFGEPGGLGFRGGRILEVATYPVKNKNWARYSKMIVRKCMK